MKYVLFVSFCYKHYKKENYFRVYLDDKLIDEVSLRKDINRVGIDFVKKNLDKHSWLRRDLVNKYKLSNGAFPLLTERLWLYEVEIPNGTKPEIKLEFKITDNNYTNGFMTKSAMVRLEKIGLIALDKFKKMMKGYWYEPWAYFKNKRLRLAELMKHVCAQGIRYPTADLFTIQTKSKSHELGNFTGWDEWVGEDFSATLKTITKHKTLILQGGSRVPIGIVEIDPVFLLMSKHQDVINIYNEDQ